MAIMEYETGTRLSGLNKRKTESLCNELASDKSRIHLAVFLQCANESYKFNTVIDGLRFRIDCAEANEMGHPNREDAYKLYYLQLQDNNTPSGTYANVVYPQMRADVTASQGYTAGDLIDAIIRSLTEHKGYYLYV